jgi:taurine dioxygenase
MTSIPARPLEPFGVELDIDLRDDVTDRRDELASLFAAHDLVLVRGARLTMDEQIRAVGCLGPVLYVDNGIMSRDTEIGLLGAALCFHSDYAYSPEPLIGISLHAIDAVDDETSTRFAAGRTAYERLSTELQARVEGLDALQVFGADIGRRNRLAELDPRLPSTAHPLVSPHTGTGGSYLFAPEMTTDSIVGLDPEESEELVQQLFAVLYAESNVLEHRWREGDLVIWNNRCVVHARGDVSQVEHRVLQRVALGTKGYFDLYPWLAEYSWAEDGSLVGPTTPATS